MLVNEIVALDEKFDNTIEKCIIMGYDVDKIRRFCNKIVNDPDWFEFLSGLRAKYHSKVYYQWNPIVAEMKRKVNELKEYEDTPKFTFYEGNKVPFGFTLKFGNLMYVKFYIKGSGKDTSFYFYECL